MTDDKKGFLYLFISLLCGASVYIISKSILKVVDINSFMIFWFGTASFNVTFFILFFGGNNTSYKSIFLELRKNLLFYIYILSSELGAALLFFYLIKCMNPAVISFIENLNPLFVLIISILFLKEKMNKIELLGGLISLSGIILLTFSYINGSLFLILLSVLDIFVYAVNATVIRWYREKFTSICLASLRIYTIFFAFFIIDLFKKGIFVPNGKYLFLLLIGGTVGPFLGMFSYFKSLQYLKASTVSFINRLKPFLVFFGASFILGYEMSKKSFISGVLIVLGTALLIKGREKYQVKTE